MREVVVISGKGGTGKTSLTGAFSSLAGKVVLADCDVDAPDLTLIMNPLNLYREDFSGGSRARIEPSSCTACGTCKEVCRFGALSQDGPPNRKGGKTFRVDPLACEGCGVCSHFCPTGAVRFSPVSNGEWFIATTRFGPMVHARLGIAQENSGKLVNVVRAQARKIAVEKKIGLTLVDGPPGIGCPVIATITGADLVLVVTEPTLSAWHDLSRVNDLTRHFGIKTLLIINKWDLNRELTAELELFSKQTKLQIAGKVAYDQALNEAQLHKKTIVEYQKNGVASEIRRVWIEVTSTLAELDTLP